MLGFGGSFGASGVKKYATVDDLPLTNVKPGTLAHVEQNLQGVSALYLWNGSQISGGWYKVATVNLAPSIVVGPESSYSLPNDGAALTLTLVADDPEGLPISWSFVSPDGDLTGYAVVAQSGNVFSIAADPALIASQTSGSFSLTFKASDGVSLSAATSVFSLSFSIGPVDPLTAADVSSFPTPDQDAITSALVRVGPEHVLAVLRSPVAPNAPVSYIYDVSTPSAPVLIGPLEPRVPEFTATIGFGKEEPAVSNGMFAVVQTGANSAQFAVYDVTDPTIPVFAYAASASKTRACGTNQQFLLTNSESGVQLRRFSDFSVVGSYIRPFGSYSGPKDPRNPIDYDGNVFVVSSRNTSTGADGMDVFTADAAGALTPAAILVSDGDAYPFYFDGRYVYSKLLADGRIQVWDLYVPTAPVKVFEEAVVQSESYGITNKIVVADGFLYAHGSVISVYDATDPTNLLFLGTVPGTGTLGTQNGTFELASGALIFGEGASGSRAIKVRT